MITVNHVTKTLQLNQDQEVVINQTQKIVQLNYENPSRTYMARAFSFVAIEGQSEFTLPSVPREGGMIYVGINGTLQNKQGGDYSTEENVLTLNAGVSAGDIVYGIYEQK